MLEEYKELKQLFSNLRLSAEQIKILQGRKLRLLIRHAYECVPYYRQLFQSARIVPDDIRTIDDIERIPITTKDNLRAAGIENIIAKGTNLDSCHIRATSGTSGKPFKVYFGKSDSLRRRALEFRTLAGVGLRPLDRLAVLGPGRPHHVRFHQRLGLYRSVNISPLLSMDEQLQAIKLMNPTVLWIYPTVFRAFLQNVGAQLDEIIHPKFLVSSAEVFDNFFRDKIRESMNIEMFDFYGSIEAGRIAAECRAHNGLHVQSDHVFLECLANGHNTKQGEPGATVITNFDNFTMPFIRYYLGDICTFLNTSCTCGSAFPLISAPWGRNNDMIKLADGRIVSPFMLIFIIREFSEIIQYRYIQESYSSIVLQLVLNNKEARSGIEEQLQRNFTKQVGESMHLEIQIVNSIDDKALKFKPFISKI